MKLLHAATLFFTLGLALAREFFLQLGWHADYATIGLLGLAITTLLIFRGWVPLLAIGVLVILIGRSDAALAAWHLDRQYLQAAAVVILVYPWLRRVLLDG